MNTTKGSNNEESINSHYFDHENIFLVTFSALPLWFYVSVTQLLLWSEKERERKRKREREKEREREREREKERERKREREKEIER